MALQGDSAIDRSECGDPNFLQLADAREQRLSPRVHQPPSKISLPIMPGCWVVPTLSVGCIETGRQNGNVVLNVRDRGIGVPANEQRRIFDRFVRGEAAKRACIQGTGIGLAMVREIVEAHDGRVTLTSEPGVGSTFVVQVPVIRTIVSRG